jgi:3-oxoadipate enol-lactonase
MRQRTFAGVTSSLRIRTAGASLNVVVRGAGPPLLFVHGFPLDHTQWERQLLGLTGWRAIAPDLRGAGRSDVPDQGYSMARYADDLAAVLDAVQAKEAVCCGFSMGGYVLFELWRRHPGRVRALILCDTRAEADTPVGKRGRDELSELTRREGMGPVVDRLLPKLVSETTRRQQPALVEVVRSTMLQSPVPGVVGALHAMRDRADSSEVLGDIAVPTLVVCGAQDVITPPDVMRPLAARIAGAHYVEVPLAGHLSPLEQPEIVNGAFAGFLQGL